MTIEVFTRNKTCLITILHVLEVKEYPLCALVANVHLSHNKKRGDVKLAQINLILRGIEQLKKHFEFKGFKVLLFLCGDFNCTPGSIMFQFLTKGSFDCKTVDLERVSGQISSQISLGRYLVENYEDRLEEIIFEETHYHTTPIGNPSKFAQCDMEKLTSWYMYVLNPYFKYDLAKKELKIKSKLTGDRIQRLAKNLYALNNDQRNKLRIMYCTNWEEFDDLTDNDNKKSDLFNYKLTSPFTFKNAYSEVCKQVRNYIAYYLTGMESEIYNLVDSESQLKKIIGPQFNEIKYEDLESIKETDILKNHTMESPYSYCLECFMKSDYIFFYGKKLIAIKEYEIPPSNKIIDLGLQCPNEDIPSDHLPVGVEFRYIP